jgi:hypothetical protein
MNWLLGSQTRITFLYFVITLIMLLLYEFDGYACERYGASPVCLFSFMGTSTDICRKPL